MQANATKPRNHVINSSSRSETPTSAARWRTLSVPCRVYLYGLHGFFLEVMFTAAWELVVSGSLKLHGCTSVWCLFIYSFSCLVMEKIHDGLEPIGLPLHLRALAQTFWIYVWEFSTGWFLRKLNGCPWDYADFTYNFCGLVTLEYAPLWYVCGFLFEYVLLPNVRRLRWHEGGNAEGQQPLGLPGISSNGYVVHGRKRK
ncbi:transmembrane protein 229B-like [Ixodes scapularis]